MESTSSTTTQPIGTGSPVVLPGGHTATVEKLNEAGDYADCVWFDEQQQLQQATYAIADLQLVTDLAGVFSGVDEDIKAAFHGEILGKVDELGPGGTIEINGTTVTVSAWRHGRRVFGHGTTTAAALAEFHTHADA